ncbi:MAG: ribonuclease III [Bdellovibrionales bacterium]|nr:ribonuclease III [Bdellovibrionales bacterium]
MNDFSTDMIEGIEAHLDYTFSSKELLMEALTHRSAVGKGKRSHYEQLEFLGDAVFDLVVADLLLEAYPEAQEGELSKMRAALVNTESLAVIAKEIDLPKFVRVSRAERAQSGHHRPSILADVTESLIGAVYRDGGYEKAFAVVQKLIGQSIHTVDPIDPKTELQELLHTLAMEAPEYLLEQVEGPEHEPIFVSVVQVSGEVIGRGQGRTKKASQQLAAREGLTVLHEKFPPQTKGGEQ